MMPTKLKLRTACRSVHLHLSLSQSVVLNEIYGILFTPGSDSLAYGCSKISEARVAIAHDGKCVVWLGRTAFDVRAQDAELIAATFGLPIQREESAAPAVAAALGAAAS